MAEPLPIRIENLYKIFGPEPAKYLEAVKNGMSKEELRDKHGHILGLNNIQIHMPAGQIQVVMGLSGSGKSTLIRHINRLIEPTGGEVWVGAQNVTKLGPKALRQFRQSNTAMVFQKFALLPHLTVLENAEYGLKLSGAPTKTRRALALQWLDRVGLTGYEGQYPNQLSGGMQQRVGLARALATDTPVLLMDEAYSALDPLIRNDMQSMLLDLQQDIGKTIVFITHDLDEALRLGDRIAILRDGSVVQQGSGQEIVLNPIDDYIRSFVKDVNRGRVIRCKALMKTGPTMPGPTVQAQTVLEDAARLLSETGSENANVVNKNGVHLGVIGLADIIGTMVPPRTTD